MSVREMEGNVKVEDSDIPKGYKKLEFEFENSTGKEICDLTITTHSDSWYLNLIVVDIPFWDAPDILKVKVTNESGQTIGEKDYSNETEPGTTKSHLDFKPCIKEDERFKVEIEFDMEFETGDWIEFSPSRSGNVGIAFANPDSSFSGSTLLAGVIASSSDINAALSDKGGIASLLDAGLPISADRLRPIQSKRVLGQPRTSVALAGNRDVMDRLSNLEQTIAKLRQSLESKHG